MKKVMGILLTIALGLNLAGTAFAAGEITVVSREAGSGTRGAFVELTGVEVKDADGKKVDKTYEDAIIQNGTAQVITTVEGDENCFATSEVVEHCGDAVGPLLQGRRCGGSDGVGCSRPRLIEEDQSPYRGHRLDPALKGRQLWHELAVREPVRHQHEVASARWRRAIGDAQVAVQRITHLREHPESVAKLTVAI